MAYDPSDLAQIHVSESTLELLDLFASLTTVSDRKMDGKLSATNEGLSKYCEVSLS